MGGICLSDKAQGARPPRRHLGQQLATGGRGPDLQDLVWQCMLRLVWLGCLLALAARVLEIGTAQRMGRLGDSETLSDSETLYHSACVT